MIITDFIKFISLHTISNLFDNFLTGKEKQSRLWQHWKQYFVPQTKNSQSINQRRVGLGQTSRLLLARNDP